MPRVSRLVCRHARLADVSPSPFFGQIAGMLPLVDGVFMDIMELPQHSEEALPNSAGRVLHQCLVQNFATDTSSIASLQCAFGRERVLCGAEAC
eukprot:scaffold6934_cov134-Pinguiococcus_pyrenoidosus.AAC.1